MKFQFGYDVLTLPGAILSHTDANAVQLRVILWLASDLTLARKPRQLAKLADCESFEIRTVHGLGYKAVIK